MTSGKLVPKNLEICGMLVKNARKYLTEVIGAVEC